MPRPAPSSFELGLHHTPTVVTYKLGLLNYILGRYIFRIILPHYTLPNIILNKTIYEEFFHRKIDPNDVAAALKRALNKDLSKESAQLQTLLGTPTPIHEALSLS